MLGWLCRIKGQMGRSITDPNKNWNGQKLDGIFAWLMDDVLFFLFLKKRDY